MKKLLLVLCVFGVPTLAVAAQAERGRERVTRGKGHPTWRALAYRLPGGYGFLDRLDLSEEQQKVLGEIHTEWATRWSKAYRAAMSEIPRLTREDYKDRKKVRAYNAKARAAYRTVQVAPPTELVANVLTPEQLGKVLEADKVVEEWAKWLTAHLDQYGTKLDAAVGPAAEDPALAAPYAYGALDAYLPGAAGLVERLGLTEEQRAALEKLSAERQTEYHRLMAPLVPSLRRHTRLADQQYAIRSALSKRIWEDVAAKQRGRVEALLTTEQKEKLAKGVKVIQERDVQIADRYKVYAEKVDKVLPRLKAGAPAYYPGYPYGVGRGGAAPRGRVRKR